MISVRPLSAIPHAQAKVVRTTNSISLISYETLVAEIQGAELVVYGLYSMTTRRHISAFVREYCDTDYATAKECYEKGLRFDIIARKFRERRGY